jgi:thioredoxin-like negative regulator of GroEL
VAVFKYKWLWGIALAAACVMLVMLLSAQATSQNKIVYVYSDSCPYCASFQPTFEKVSDDFLGDHTGWSIERLDIFQDDQFAKAQEMGAVVTPTVFVVKGDEVLGKVEGDVSEQAFRQFLKRNVEEPAG